MAAKGTLIAKITRPLARGIIPRGRLFRKLDLRGKFPVVWISCPAGSGKTSLVSNYLDARKLRCLWYQLDEGDGDIATFFYYMGMAVERATTGKGKPLPLFSSEYLQEVQAFTRRYFEDLYSRLRNPFIIVLDNYQDVPIGSEFLKMITIAFDMIPQGVNIFVLSRNEPPPLFARLRANGKVLVLGWDEIRLTLKESDEITRLRTKNKLSKETIAYLHKKTDGWVAGLVLMVECWKGGEFEPQVSSELTSSEIIDYFGNELFMNMERRLQEFLLQTAFLPKISTKMAESLTHFPDAGNILASLCRNNYFTRRCSYRESLYEYHPLFREFLLSRARVTFPPARLSILLKSAAVLLENSGQTEAAVALYRDAGDWDALVSLIKSQRPSLRAQGRSKTLEEWIVSIPEKIRENNPQFLYWLMYCKQESNPMESLLLNERAFHLFQAQKDVSGTFESWVGGVGCIMLWHNYHLLDSWIEWLEEYMRQNGSFPSPEMEALVASRMALALTYRGHPDNRSWMERSLSLSRKIKDVQLRRRINADRLIYCHWMGDFFSGMGVIEEEEKIWESSSFPLITEIGWRIIKVSFCITTFADYELGLKLISETLEIARTAGIYTFDHLLFAQGAYCSLCGGDYAQAGEFLRKTEVTPTTSPRFLFHYHHLKAWYHLLLGEMSTAFVHSEVALKLTTETGMVLFEGLSRLTMAQILKSKGEHKKAEYQLTRAFAIIHNSGSSILEYMYWMVKAQFAFDRGGEPAGLEFLRKAMTMGSEQGYINMVYWWQPSVMAILCTKALEAGIEVEYVQDLIRKRNLIAEKPLFHLENWPWPLKIYTLGRFLILKDGRPLQFNRKVQQKPLSMLKALIAFGGKGVREDQIMDTLWPEADGDMAHQSFATNLHRLRQLLGYEKAIQRKERRLTLDQRYCWVDVWAFESILEQANAQWKEGKILGAAQLMEKAIEIYKGPFLAQEIEETWKISLTELLRSKFLRSIEKLGQCCQQTDQWEKALDCYLKGLEVDDIAEEFYQGLMNIYSRLGRVTDALGVYQRYRKTFSTLGLEPSAKIEAINKSLFSANQGTGELVNELQDQ